MNTPEISVKCYEIDAEILALKTAWEELHSDSVVSSIYNSFLFIYESIQVFKFREVTKKVFTLTDDNTGQLIAIFPMQKYRNAWKFISFNTFETTALNEIMDKPYPVIRNGYHDLSWKMFLNHLKNNVSDWDHLFLRDIPFSYPALKLLPEICEEQNLICHIDYNSNSTEISVDGEWNDFWLKHRTMRRNVSKLERAFEDKLAFTVYGNDSDSEQDWKWCLDQYIDLENKTWKKGLGVTENKETISFYYRLCEQLDATGQLKFGFLTIDDQLITATIAYTHNDTVYFPQGCYDPEFKKYSPNMVNLTYFLKYFYESKYKKVDFLCGYADFISKWADTEIKTYDINIYAKQPAIRFMFTGKAIQRAICSRGARLKKDSKKEC